MRETSAASREALTKQRFSVMPNAAADIDKVLRVAITNRSAADVVSQHVLERLPHIFANDWEPYRKWRQKLGAAIGVDPCNICLIGSACVGVSFNPNKGLSKFEDSSDIDVAIVSDFHFNVAWRSLRGFRLADARTPKERQSLIAHRNRYIYWGCIATDKILRIFPFAKEWTIAISNMRAEPPTEDREIKFRIYKDYDALRTYQILGVKSLRVALLED